MALGQSQATLSYVSAGKQAQGPAHCSGLEEVRSTPGSPSLSCLPALLPTPSPYSPWSNPSWDGPCLSHSPSAALVAPVNWGLPSPHKDTRDQQPVWRVPGARTGHIWQGPPLCSTFSPARVLHEAQVCQLHITQLTAEASGVPVGVHGLDNTANDEFTWKRRGPCFPGSAWCTYALAT